MVSDAILTLLQVVALTLPAIGIYMQIIHSSELERATSGGLEGMSKVQLRHDYQLARSGMVVFSFAGVFLVIEIFMEKVLGIWVLHTLLVSVVLGLIAVGLISLIGSALVQNEALESDVSLKRAWGSVFDRIPYLKRINPW